MKNIVVLAILASVGLAGCSLGNPGRPHNAGKDWSYTISRDVYDSPPDSIRIELRVGDLTNDYNIFKPRWASRNEIMLSVNDKARIGESRFYKWSFYLDENTDWAKVQSVFGQIHPGPEADNNTGGWPIFAQYFNEGDLNISWRGHDKDSPIPTTQGTYILPNVQPKKWYRYGLEVRYALNETGYVRLWIDGKQVVDYMGPFGHAKGRHYLKIGFYDGDNSFPKYPKQDRVVYFDDLDYGHGFLPASVKQ
jgi:hypothetical protein